jgi:hypothetical protein
MVDRQARKRIQALEERAVQRDREVAELSSTVSRSDHQNHELCIRETSGKTRATGRPKPSAIANPRAECFDGELHGGQRANVLTEKRHRGGLQPESGSASREERGHSSEE